MFLNNKMINSAVGVVVIGRNEGARLEKCLDSLSSQVSSIVYVDSGSTDGSVSLARDKGVAIVELDMSLPFTAARARNFGANRLRGLAPEIIFIQFIDGDCEVAHDWLRQAVSFLESRLDVAVVSGRRRERYPEYSIYNLMCDIEWSTPIGQSKSCGGDAMMRADVFAHIGGYRDSLIAGEEPELCVRIRALDWKIWRIDAEMVLHDAAMGKFSQWWRRTLRCGHAFGEGAYLHGAPPECHWVAESNRAWFWGLGIPLIIILSIFMFGPWALVLLLIYPAQVIRLALLDKTSRPVPWLRAMFTVLGKFPEMLGQMRFLYARLRGQRIRLIEYK